MANEVKRMRYFDRLFLKQEEFNLEQDYHIRMRRLHNSTLYRWGVLRGLEVKAGTGPKEITVTQGMALNRVTIDDEEIGQEIVLPEDTPLDLSEYAANDTVYIFISYLEEKADIVDERGGPEEKIHWLEKAVLSHKKDAPPSNNKANIILAKIKVNTDGTIGIFYDENGTRIRNDAALMVKGGLNVGGDKDPGRDNLLVKGRCTIEGDLLVEGQTTTVSTENLEVKDNIITLNKGRPKKQSGLEVNRGGPPEAQLIWDENEGKWKAGIKGSLTDLAHGANAGELTNNAVADSLHRHSKLVSADGKVDPVISVDDSGNVGIGTTAPETRLHVVKDGNGSYTIHEVYRESDGAGGLVVRHARGTKKDPTILQNGDATLLLQGRGYDGSQFLEAADIAMQVDGLPGPNSMPGRIIFFTTPAGAVKSHERMRIDNNGNVGIGTTDPANKLTVYDPGGNSPVGAMSIDVQTFRTLANSQASYFFRVRDIGAKSTPFYIRGDGNVGIGTNTPQQKLDVIGNIRSSGEIITTSPNSFRLLGGKYGAFLRNDGSNYYLLFTNPDDQYGSWNTLRPFYANLASGNVGIGNSALYVQHGGNVGIGTTDPAEGLELYNKNLLFVWPSRPENYRRLLLMRTGIGSSNFGYKFSWRNDDGSLRLSVIEMDETGGVYFNGGNVGIGTTSPQAKLDISGSVNINNEGEGAVLLYLATERHWQLRQLGTGASTALELASVGGGGNKNFVISTTGNVGIGTTDPSQKLDVNGTVRANSFIGSGEGLTGLNGSQITSGVISQDFIDRQLIDRIGEVSDGTALKSDVTALTDEIVNARGTKDNLNNRLNVSLAEDGLLRQQSVGPGQLTDELAQKINGALPATPHDFLWPKVRDRPYVRFTEINTSGAEQTMRLGFIPKFVLAIFAAQAILTDGHYHGVNGYGWAFLNPEAEIVYIQGGPRTDVYRVSEPPYLLQRCSLISDCDVLFVTNFYDSTTSPTYQLQLSISISPHQVTDKSLVLKLTRGLNDTDTGHHFTIEVQLLCYV